jgi:hypothetical protein
VNPSRVAPPVNAPRSVRRQAYGEKGNGLSLVGKPISGVNADHGSLRAVDVQTGKTLRGLELVGAIIPLRYTDGTEGRAQIVAWDGLSTAPVDLFLLENESGDDPCGYADAERKNPIWAMAVPAPFDLETGLETDDSTVYTLACRGGAIARCIELGYRKWDIGTEIYKAESRVRFLSPYHAACVAALRADYCGDGQSHSIDGTPFAPWDPLGLKLDSTTGSRDEKWGPYFFEAEWSASGAYCISKTRYMPAGGFTLEQNQAFRFNPDWEYVLNHCPWRIAGFDDKVHAVRPCGYESSFLPENGFRLPDQNQRSLLRTNSPLYTY